MTWLQKFLFWLDTFLENLVPPPAYDKDPRELEMNQPPEAPLEPKIEPVAKETAAQLLCAEAKKWLGKDASPRNRAPQELSCAEGVISIVNSAFPNTLDPNIVGTGPLDQALHRSPKFKGVLDPVEGCIEISPQTATVHGHVGIYVGPDSIASNDSRTGKFEINYTRQSWRDTFIKKRGLKAHLFLPI